MLAEYEDPGSDVGRYENAGMGFFGSRLAAVCWSERSEGGPGRISVAKGASGSGGFLVVNMLDVLLAKRKRPRRRAEGSQTRKWMTVTIETGANSFLKSVQYWNASWGSIGGFYLFIYIGQPAKRILRPPWCSVSWTNYIYNVVMHAHDIRMSIVRLAQRWHWPPASRKCKGRAGQGPQKYAYWWALINHADGRIQLSHMLLLLFIHLSLLCIIKSSRGTSRRWWWYTTWMALRIISQFAWETCVGKPGLQ